MLARKIAFNTIVSAATRVLGTTLALVTIGLLTRYLGKNEWGEYSIVLTFGGIFAILADLGLYQLMVREISKEGADETKIASQIFSLRLISGLFIFALAPLISLFFPYSPQARWAILIGAAGFWLLSGNQVLMGIFQKYLRMDKVALAEVAGRLVQLILIFIFIKLRFGFLLIVSTLAFSSLVNLFLIFWLAQRHVPVRLTFDFGSWKKILAVSYPLALASILTMVYFSTDALILSVFWPAADVGIYKLPYKILESLIFFPSMFAGLIMPMLARSAFVDWPRFKNIFQRAQDVLLIFAIPLVSGTFVLSPAIIRLLGGSQYPESVAILNILMVATAIIFLGTLFSFGLVAINQQKRLWQISAAGAVFNVLVNLIFIPRYSYYAAAASTVLTEALVVLLMLLVVYKTLSFMPSFKIGGRSLLAASVMTLVLWWLKDFNLFFLLGVAAAVYFGVLYLLKGFSAQEILALMEKQNV